MEYMKKIDWSNIRYLSHEADISDVFDAVLELEIKVNELVDAVNALLDNKDVR